MNAHGNAVVSCEGRMIKAKFSGSFNSTGVLKYVNEIKSLVHSLDGASFVILADYVGLEGGTPNAYKVFESYSQWLNKQPLIAKATVSQSLIKMQIVRSLSPSQKHQNIQVFEKENEAICWLESELANALAMSKVIG